MMTTTSNGLNGASPHGPLHAADVMAPVEPLLTPTARPNENAVVIAPESWTTLHLSPAKGSHGGVTRRSGPDEVGIRHPGRDGVRGIADDRDVARDQRSACDGIRADHAAVLDLVVPGRALHQAGIRRADRLDDASPDRGRIRRALSIRERAVDRQQRAARQRPGVHRVQQRVAVVAQEPDIDRPGPRTPGSRRGPGRTERGSVRPCGRACVVSTGALSGGPLVVVVEVPVGRYSRTIWTVELIGIDCPNSNGKIEW